MRIDPTGASPLSAQPLGAVPPVARAGDSPSPVVDGESFMLSADLAALLLAVRQSPEVRAEVIETVAARLAEGLYQSPEAAAEAAHALLNSGELAPPAAE
ncbi:MAG: hypothetical protein RMJ56_14830 [Gemmataceae bacterium]|nr:hypothetical protein [Gemmata sp.]MDW8198870.1 hypothetical protein [Gemmataceae bacterium]